MRVKMTEIKRTHHIHGRIMFDNDIFNMVSFSIPDTTPEYTEKVFSMMRKMFDYYKIFNPGLHFYTSVNHTEDSRCPDEITYITELNISFENPYLTDANGGKNETK